MSDVQDIPPAPLSIKRPQKDGPGWLVDLAFWITTLRDVLRGRMIEGLGDPEGVVTAKSGTMYLRRDGGAGSSFYVKESTTGSTGWAAK